MMKNAITTFLLIALSLNLSAQDSLNIKIIEMMKLMGVDEQFEVAITNMFTIQQETNSGALNDEFLDEFMKEVSKDDWKELKEALIPIYIKYLNEEEIDNIIEFYSSETGKSLKEKNPLIITESMKLGGDLGEKIAMRVFARMSEDDEELFNTNLEGCEEFREGEYTAQLPGDVEIEITRTNDIQIEKANGLEFKFKLTWLSDCKYKLEYIEENGQISDTFITTTNIFEINGNSYKCIAKDQESEAFIKLEMRKVH